MAQGCYALGGMLENQGINVSYAVDGNGAIYAAVTDCPDLMFLDLIMPQIDGFQVIAQLRKMRKTRRIPVILVTGRTEGTGLGLPLAQDLVNRHGGLIEYDSFPGRTIFTVLLPIAGME